MKANIDSSRNTARIVGVLFIIGTVAGILSVVFLGSLMSSPDYLKVVASNASRVTMGALLIFVMAIALAMIPVLMFPILKKHNEPLAIGYVIFRGALETLTTIGLVVGWLLLLVVAHQYVDSGATAASQFSSLGILLVKANDPIMRSVVSIVFNLGALMLYYVFYQARLIPRWITVWGIVAAVLGLVAGLAAVFGINLDFLYYIMLPQEMVMAVWLIVKGFNTSAPTSDSVKTGRAFA
jgi:Domain of unknown function (DUF4386)